jgi:hypothetical protein
MEPSLDGAFAKIRRARQHFDYLDRSVRRALNSHRYGVVVENNGDRRVVTTTPKHANDIGLRIGDVVHNARSALDHLVWQLVIANGERPGIWNQYPIAVEPDHFPGSFRGTSYLKGISDKAIDFIKSTQPYIGGNGGESNPLAVLQKLSNTDKHNVIVPVGIGIQYAVVETDYPFSAARSVRVQNFPVFNARTDSSVSDGPFEEGAIIPVASNPKMKIDRAVTPVVMFGNIDRAGGRDIFFALDKSIQEVKRILGEARVFIS